MEPGSVKQKRYHSELINTQVQQRFIFSLRDLLQNLQFSDVCKRFWSFSNRDRRLGTSVVSPDAPYWAR